MSPPSQAGSSAYLLSDVGGLAEAQRLRRQAAINLSTELPPLLRALPQGGVFLDLGCGTGLLAETVARQRPDARVFGVDADALAVSEARQVFGSVPNLSFACARLEDGPPPGLSPADVAVLRLVLMHLPDPVGCLRLSAAWIKPSGELHVIEGDDRGVILEPEADWLIPMLEIMETVQRQRGGSRRLGRELERLLLQAGWQLRTCWESAPDPSLAAQAVGQVFLPVIEFHLAQAAKLGLADAGFLGKIRERMRSQFAAGFARAFLPLYHASARPEQECRP